MEKLLDNNFWIEYFLQNDMHGKENWIDFEVKYLMLFNHYIMICMRTKMSLIYMMISQVF